MHEPGSALVGASETKGKKQCTEVPCTVMRPRDFVGISGDSVSEPYSQLC